MIWIWNYLSVFILFFYLDNIKYSELTLPPPSSTPLACYSWLPQLSKPLVNRLQLVSYSCGNQLQHGCELSKRWGSNFNSQNISVYGIKQIQMQLWHDLFIYIYICNLSYGTPSVATVGKFIGLILVGKVWSFSFRFNFGPQSFGVASISIVSLWVMRDGWENPSF